MIKRPKILILDEATSSLDVKAEKEVQDALDKIREEYKMTIVVIAHRLSTIKGADRIIMLGCGNILEMGSHSELIKNPKGEYRKLVDAQIVKELEKKVDEHEEEQEKINKEKTIEEEEIDELSENTSEDN